jgi:hypothetical protein
MWQIWSKTIVSQRDGTRPAHAQATVAERYAVRHSNLIITAPCKQLMELLVCAKTNLSDWFTQHWLQELLVRAISSFSHQNQIRSN